jgi:hypothetical protein
MGRIRTIKPQYFRHEEIFEAEKRSGMPLRVIYAGLWTVADREGRFEWKPRILKLDVAPFDDLDFEAALVVLCQIGVIAKYAVKSKTYAHIPSWHKHQQVNVREAKSTIPAPEDADESTCVHMHEQVHGDDQSCGEREGEREREGKGREGEEVVEQAQPAPSNPEPEEPLGTNWQELTPTDPLSTKGWPKSVDLRIAARFWNQMAGEVGLPEVRALTGERSKHLAARLKDIGSLGEWFASVNAIKDQPFLTGRNDRKWRANFDWFVKPSNFSKVIENTYERSNANGRA